VTGLERLFRQTGRTTRRLHGALCFARAGRAVAFLAPSLRILRAAQSLAGRIDADAKRLIFFRIDDPHATRGLPPDHVVVRDHTCAP
jgi:hypothetical protein